MAALRILVCDDDPALLALLSRRLDKLGFEHDAASDGREAMSLMEEKRYAAIVADIYMPEATGLEVLQQAKRLDADTQVVIITSAATLDNAVDSLNHGAFGYLTKPFDHLIVFDNMVSRAVEHHRLLLASKRKAEAQKRRGDMLEDEVARRLQQLQKKQKALVDLLGSLPDGIVVVEEGGKVVMSSPSGERWLARDQKSEDQPIRTFISQVHSKKAELNSNVRLEVKDLQLMAMDFPDDGAKKRRAVIIREDEAVGIGAGSIVTETVMDIKKGLATLYEEGMGTEVVLNIASQFAVLEQMAGWAPRTGNLSLPQVSDNPAPAQEPEANDGSREPLAETPTSAAPTESPSAAPAEPAQPEPAPQEQTPAPPAQTADGAGEVTLVPPFTIPRERTPTGELDGPRLNTSELEDALRAAAPPDAQQDAAEPPTENAVPQEIVAGPQIHPSDPIEETLVSSTIRGEESYEEPADGVAAVEALAAAQREESNPQVHEALLDKAAPEVPVDSIAQPVDSATVAPGRSEAQAPGIEDAAPVEAPAPSPADPSPPPKSETQAEPDTQPTEAAAPTAIDETLAPAREDPELSNTKGDPTPEPAAFPRAEAGTGDVPSWIDGITGSTDTDILLDFEFESEQPEASLPQAQAGELSDDDSMFRPRVIPEEMSAKLDTPIELPNPNGDPEHASPQHDGPITIQASQADTQMFRNVLEGLSGAQVMSGDYEKQEEEPPKINGDTEAKAEEGLNEMRTELSKAPAGDVREEPLETSQAELPSPSPEELRAVQEPEPEPQGVQAEPANWPPTLPTKDDDWDEELDVTG